MRAALLLVLLLCATPCVAAELRGSASGPPEPVAVMTGAAVVLTLEADCTDVLPRVGLDGRTRVAVAWTPAPDMQVSGPSDVAFDATQCAGPQETATTTQTYDVRVGREAPGLVPAVGRFNVSFVEDRLGEVLPVPPANISFELTPAAFIAYTVTPMDALPQVVDGAATVPVRLQSSSNVDLLVQWQAAGRQSLRDGEHQPLPEGGLRLPGASLLGRNREGQAGALTSNVTYTVPGSGAGVDEFLLTVTPRIQLQPDDVVTPQEVILRIPYTHRDGAAVVGYEQSLAEKGTPGLAGGALVAVALALRLRRR